MELLRGIRLKSNLDLSIPTVKRSSGSVMLRADICWHVVERGVRANGHRVVLSDHIELTKKYL